MHVLFNPQRSPFQGQGPHCHLDVQFQSLPRLPCPQVFHLCRCNGGLPVDTCLPVQALLAQLYLRRLCPLYSEQTGSGCLLSFHRKIIKASIIIVMNEGLYQLGYLFHLRNVLRDKYLYLCMASNFAVDVLHISGPI